MTLAKFRAHCWTRILGVGTHAVSQIPLGSGPACALAAGALSSARQNRNEKTEICRTIVISREDRLHSKKKKTKKKKKQQREFAQCQIRHSRRSFAQERQAPNDKAGKGRTRPLAGASSGA